MVPVMGLHIGSLLLYMVSLILYWRFFITKRRQLGQLAKWTLLAGLLVHSAMLVLFTVQRQFLPLGQFATAATTFVWLFGVLYFIQESL
ncbi:MAG TPA: hypothetical protein VKA68_09995, partial [bacterium]|nr:hypothetical protein [bacterium]